MPTVHWHDFATLDAIGRSVAERDRRAPARPHGDRFAYRVRPPAPPVERARVVHWHEFAQLPKARSAETVRSYLRKYSVRPGDTLFVCASDEQGPLAVDWQIVQVIELDAVGTVTASSWVEDGKVTLPGTGNPPFDREEVGYGWPTILQRQVGAQWSPGLYAIQFGTKPNGPWFGTSFFLVRPANPKKIRVHWPWATTLAYAGGGAAAHVNMYDWGQSRRLRRVSLDRPLDLFPYEDKREHTHQTPLRLWNLLASKHLANLDPITSFDLDQEAFPQNATLFVTSGHDEYWSQKMRHRVRAFVEGGGNAAFFSGNLSFGNVRFEDSDRTMVCYKDAVEDPLTGIDDSQVTVEPSGWPVNDPENSMAGVSFRRGPYSGGKSAPYRVVAADPILASTNLKVDDTFGSAWFESDGAELTIDGKPLPASDTPLPAGLFEATGRDGTPKSFKVVAVADLRLGVASPGLAVLGYFSQNGTVFTASTAIWGKEIGNVNDPRVDQITMNVIDWLSTSVQGIPYEAPPPRAEMPVSTYNPQTKATERPWNKVGFTNAHSVAGVVSGHLLLGMGDGKILRLDPENPFGAPTPTAFPPLDGPVGSMTTDLHGTEIFCAAVRTKTVGLKGAFRGIGGGVIGLGNTFRVPMGTSLQKRVSDPSLGTSWEAVWGGNGPGQDDSLCIALAATNPDNWIFIAARESDGRWLYLRHKTIAAAPARIGRVPERIVAMTGSGYEGRLYAATSDGDLLTREGSDGLGIDLVWRRIGSVPEHTFALGHYLGRLYALTGTPGHAYLWWRPAVADTTFSEPSVLGLDGLGNAQVGTLTSGGNFIKTGSALIPELPWDLMVRAGDGSVFFWRYQGESTLRRFSTNGSNAVLASWKGFLNDALFTHLAYARDDIRGHVLLYNGATMDLTVGRFVVPPPWSKAPPTFLAEQPYAGFGRWSHIVPTNDGHVVFHNSKTGAFKLVHVERDGALTLRAQGVMTAPAPSPRLRADSIAAAGQDLVVFYWNDGAAEIWQVDGNAFVRRLVLPPGQLGLLQAAGAFKLIGHDNGILLAHGPRPVLQSDPRSNSYSLGVRVADRDELRTFSPNTGAFDDFKTVVSLGVLR